jgi:hypothetical protein
MITRVVTRVAPMKKEMSPSLTRFVSTLIYFVRATILRETRLAWS